jgi:hypothetical protein
MNGESAVSGREEGGGKQIGMETQYSNSKTLGE